MAGIAGISGDGKQKQVERMLKRLTHRGKAGVKVVEGHGATLGAVWPEAQVAPTSPMIRPNPAIIAAIMAKRASAIRVRLA